MATELLIHRVIHRCSLFVDSLRPPVGDFVDNRVDPPGSDFLP